MLNQPEFDLAAAHRYFAALCFNLAWELIDKSGRTPEEDEQMLRLNQASIWHWTQRPDCQPKNLSIGYWQASRIHILLGRVDEAKRYAELCRGVTPDDDPFLMGFACEALARSSLAGGDGASAEAHVAIAREYAAQVSDADDRRLLLQDLENVSAKV